MTTDAGRAVPASTYRVQVTAGFDLFATADLLGYLHDLGADWVYLSPLLAAQPGSDHGYDVVAHDRIDPSRGGAAGLAAVSAEARRLGMGVLVDIVPNHVGVAVPAENAWWWDLLRCGRASAHANAFDVDWDFAEDRIRIPVVGDDDQDAPDGPIRNLAVVDGELRYHDHRFPIAPDTLGTSGQDDDANDVHARQHYRLVGWRSADDQLNYRRFFAVSTLAAIRVEDADVFAASHAEVRRWFDEGLVDGLRVDHPDGLRDPAAYLEDLGDLTGNAYVLVEKILETGEQLEASWRTDGTTGYDVLALLDRVLVDPEGQAPLDRLDDELRADAMDWAMLVHDSKRAVADGILGAEVGRIVREVIAGLQDQAAAHDEVPDAGTLRDAVAELLACFPVYRSYLPAGRSHLDEAVALALRNRPDLDAAVRRLAAVLGDPNAPAALRFQQTSGMVMAKGVEDSAFYRWSRLTSLNEVGADPSVFARTPAQFHDEMALRQRDWPHAMTALSTHDTKRGEDTRARITAIAELPEQWQLTLRRLLELAPVPDPGLASLFWQAVIGAWPASRERLHGYATKAMREAGEHTGWTDPDEPFEQAVHGAVDAAYDDPAVRDVVEAMVSSLTRAGWSNSLSAKLLSLTVPGVPDVYQGSELWEQSLVDPDNRRPVDFAQRVALLASLRSGAPARLTDTPDDSGIAKLQVTHSALTLRRDRPELFTSYSPVHAEGPARDHVVAFDRGGAIAVATRLPVGLAAKGGWADTTVRLPAGQWVDVLTGTIHPGQPDGVRLADLLDRLPVALLAREEPTEGGPA